MDTFLPRHGRLLVVIAQVALAAVTNYLAFWLRFDGAIPGWAASVFVQTLPLLLATRFVLLLPFKLHEDLWRYTSLLAVRNIAASAILGSALFMLLVWYGGDVAVYPRSIPVIDTMLLIAAMTMMRLPQRLLRDVRWRRGSKRVLIFGAGDAGEMIVRDMRNDLSSDYLPVGFIDDDPRKRGRRIHGVKVLGDRRELATIIAESRPHEILVAIPYAEARILRGVLRDLQPYKLPIKTLPNLRELIDGKVEVRSIRSLSVSDLLPRAPVGLDATPLRAMIQDRVVMVTGAGGSIGSELCRQIAALNPRALLLFERYENALYTITNDLLDRRLPATIVPIIGDVTDRDRISAVLSEYKPHVVFHAAAHKHVPLMEDNPAEAVKNNVTGTRVVAEQAIAHHVERVILISTDKAVNPTSVMGATKRIAELIVRAASQDSSTKFVTVRFGNVLGSNGSVVPRFLAQIERGGPVTVTHPEMKRFFMLIPEAVQLVLHAGSAGRDGGVYVLDMGEQISVLEMARDVIRLAGFVPDTEIPIVFTGVRPGEKLTEELIADDESLEFSAVERILRVTSAGRTQMPRLHTQILELEQLARRNDAAGVLEQLQRLVPTYTPHVVPDPRPATAAVAS